MVSLIALPNNVVLAAENDFSMTIDGTLCEYTGHDTKIVLPSSVTKVQVGSFSPSYGDKNLKIELIEVEEGNENYTSIDGILYTSDEKTLIYCPPGNKRTSYTIPDSVTAIGEMAFRNCKNLTQVTLPQGLTEIGDMAFDSSGINKINIPNGVTVIQDSTFLECEKLTEVSLPDSIVSIGQFALFSHNLTKLTIPKSVTSIDEYGVYGPNLIIYGESGSAAEAYALKNDILFQANGADPIIGPAPSASASSDEKTDYELSKIFAHLRPTMSNVEKVRAVQNYFNRSIDYDIENYRAGTIPWDSYTAYGALVKKKAVCSGYTSAFRLVMQRLGIPVTSVSSSSMNHTWNMVQLDGSWYHVDTTWGNGSFLKSDAAISKSGHGLGLSRSGHFDWYGEYKATNTKYDQFDWNNTTTEQMNAGITITTATVKLDTSKYAGKVGKSYTLLAKSNIGESMSAFSSNSSVVAVKALPQSEKGYLFQLTFLKPGSATIKVRSASGAVAPLTVIVS